MRRGELAVLAGAGVSMLPPSKLPSGNQLRDIVVGATATSPTAHRFWQRLRRRSQYRALLPELALQRVYDVIHESMLPGFLPLDNGLPNLMHCVLAAAGRAGAPIVTTNFDELIEDCGAAHVLHVHGRLSDPEEMVVRVNQVGLGLTPQIQRALTSAVRERHLFILGYSGRDRDVVRALGKARPRSISWLTRSAVPAVETLQRVCPCTSESLDLEVFAADVAAELRVAPPRRVGHRPAGPRPRLAVPWHRGIGCLVRVASECGELGLAVEGCQEAVRADPSSEQVPWFAIEAATALRLLGHLHDADAWIRGGLGACRGSRGIALKAGLCNMSGLVDLDRRPPNPARALTKFDRAAGEWRRFLRTSEGVRYRGTGSDFIGKLHNNRGWAHRLAGHHTVAIREFLASIRFKRRQGNIVGRAHTAANLAISYYELGEFDRARYWRRETERICEEFDLAEPLAEVYVWTADAACRRGRIADGHRWLSAAADAVERTQYGAMRNDIAEARRRWNA